MIPFFKRRSKNYPDFWKDYVSFFANPLPKSVQECTFVVLDTETTGFDIQKDRILSIGAIRLQRQSFVAEDVLDIYLKQEVFKPETIEIHEIMKGGAHERISETQAVEIFINYIGNSILVAHHALFDISMVNSALRRLGLPKLKNKVIDTGVLYKRTKINNTLIYQEKSYSLDDLAEELDVTIQDRHTAVGDAQITAFIFMKIWLLIQESHKDINIKSILQ